ncbi:MAG: phenylacetic acid degradation protein [Verrucomicrobiaceae bacterium]|nr:phenylacetic acid degradation protein [Verrucomicrobiaceae bacterium]
MSRIPVLATVALLPCLPARSGVLEDYVARENKAFNYEVRQEVTDFGLRVSSIRLTSQEWQGKEWKHWLTVFVPPVVDSHKRGVLLIEGGSNRDGMPDPKSEAGRVIGANALSLRAPVALLLQVPNQPLFENLYEDDLIAHTFDQYLRGGDDEWPLLLPMVKSATSAMDALQSMAREGKIRTPAGQACQLDEFVVGGASKRGWTTWLTAAVDKRVCALAPSVIDVLNMADQMRHQKRSYGSFSKKIRPYTSRKIMERLETPRGKLLRKTIDPFEYIEKLHQPKLMLLGTNDPYWTVDSAQLYFPELKGPKAIYYLPNAGHGLGLGILPTLNAFLLSTLNSRPFPQLETEVIEGRMEVSWKGKGKAELWTANSPTRDFREAKWSATPLEGVERVRLTPKSPKSGWSASHVTVTFPPLRTVDAPYKVSTPITVTPAEFSHE